MLRDGYVAGHDHRSAPRLLHQPCGLVGVLVFVQVGDQDVRALTGEGERYGAPDAAVGTGDQRGLALQPARSGVGLLAVIGLGVEFALRTGWGLLLWWLGYDAPDCPARGGRNR